MIQSFEMAHRRLFVQFLLGMAALLGLAIWAFSPGLGGELIFDDYPNFLPWQQIGDVDTLDDVLQFTFSGNSMPGRPLSLISFLLDDQNWSPDIYSLKRTNLAIHLINGLLILWLTIRLLPLLLPETTTLQQVILAFFVSSIWTLHPLQVSNVSYIIQRMNLLSTMLELIGLLLFISGRKKLEIFPIKSLTLCSIGIGIFMPVAILAKENGLLLCVFALLINRFAFPPTTNQYFRVWKGLFLWLPLMAFLVYCLKEYNFFTEKLAIRNFTSWERLLTQGPIIHDYLTKLLLPKMSGSTLYYENFPVSHSFLNPLNTATSWLLIGALLATAFWLRNRKKLIAFGIFFYFSGHLMESTLIPLELYFEHRNYLPQYGLWLVLAGLISEFRSPKMAKTIGATCLVLLAILTLITHTNATLWGNTSLQTAMWYRENPGSQRATQSYMNLLLSQNRLEELEEVFIDSMQLMPNNLGLLVSRRYVDCYLLNKPTQFDDIAEFARHADYDLSSLLMLERMRGFSQEKPITSDCRHATASEIGKVYTALMANPKFNIPSIHTRLNEYMSEIAAENGQLSVAIHYLDEAYRTSHNPVYPYRQAAFLKNAGLNTDALLFITKAEEALTPRFALLYPDLRGRILALKTSLDQNPERHPDS